MSGARVLIVEDDVMLAQIIQRALEREFGLEADLVADGRTGLERASAHPYDLIVSDIRMPSVDGITMISEIRAGAGPSHDALVVLVTGHHEEGKAAADRLGAHFLCKPFGRRALVAVVEDLGRVAVRRPQGAKGTSPHRA